MSWSDLKNKAKEATQGGGQFIKLEDGQEVVGVLKGEPYVFYQIFKDKIEYPNRVPGSSMKFKVNFIVKEGETYVAKILQGGATMADQLVECKEEYGSHAVLKIKRKGKDKDTTYTVLFKANLSEAQIEEISKIKLLPLTSDGGRKSQGQYDHPVWEDSPMPEDMPADQDKIDEDIPF